MSLITQGKTNWRFLLIVVFLSVVVGGGTLWCLQKYPSYQSSGLGIPEKKSNEECQKYTEAECPEGCIVCPPCEACSSFGCYAADHCKNIGFDESWYEMIRLQRETADWQTYRNEEYGFEIKYPQNLRLKEERDSIEFADFESSTNVQITIEIKTTELSIQDYFKKYSTEEKAEGFLSKKCDSGCLYTSVSEAKDVYLDNIPAIQVHAWLYAVGGTVTLIKESSKTLIEIINFCLPSGGWTTNETLWECFEQQKTGTKRSSDTIYDQILSTFRFINK